MDPQRFRRKTVEIWAVQLTDDADWIEIAKWCGAYAHEHRPGDLKDQLAIIRHSGGTLWANVDDWIIWDTDGDFYPCKPDYFAKKFERIGPAKPDLEAIQAKELRQRLQDAINLALTHSDTDLYISKEWVIDQMVRILAGGSYETVIEGRLPKGIVS